MKPGYHEIYSRYRDNIMRGVLKPGDKVPAIRVLAEELKVARKTVETAYAILTGEGYLVSQGARGTRVNGPPAAGQACPGGAAHRYASGLAHQPARAGGFLRPGIPALDSFRIKSGCCWRARRRGHASGGDAQPAGAGLVSAAPGHRQLPQHLARLVLHRRTGADHQRLQRQPAADPRHPRQPQRQGGV
jgi:DNA-binding transcriptional MocR family regulator